MHEPHAVQVEAPSRLHFGMFSFGDPRLRQFGGVGAMIAAPGLKLRIARAEKLTASGPLAERALAIARQVLGQLAIGDHTPSVSIEITHAPREHVGLGVGTQLALAVAAGIRRCWGRHANVSATALAEMTGRAQRSSVGTYGFEQGGLIVEAGKRSGERLSPLISRVELPEDWRFVLLIPKTFAGLSGAAERQAFADLPPVPPETTAALAREALLELLPAAIDRDFETFSESLYRFNHLAGLCFAARQHGAYADARTGQLIAKLRELGIRGVGQSSWGPSVFALFPSEAAAQSHAETTHALAPPSEFDHLISSISNSGHVLKSSLKAAV